jgi:hypothetical protein
MPNAREFLPMSLVTFSKESNEEIFLLYSKGFEHGPGIHRDGQGSPWMIDRATQSRKISDPQEQRKGTWLVNEDAREMLQESISKWKQEIDRKQEENLMEPSDAEQRLSYLKELENSFTKQPDYHSSFEKAYPNYSIVGMQGCGNLTMNEWYVAYLCSPFTDNKPTFIRLPEEQLDKVPPRQYTCLVKYKDGAVRIQPLIFNFLTERVFLAGEQKDITDDIEFAVYGTQLLREGELVEFSGIVEQIADVRHLFKLPNLNPKGITKNEPHKLPRRFFGERQYDDVWFGEAELLTNLAIRRAALTEPVLLNRQFEHMGADPNYIREIFESQGYREDKQKDRLLRYSDGTWRFREETDELVEVKLFRNVYAYSLIGLDEAGNILALAVGGLAGRRGQTLESAVQNIRSYGAINALLIDQGDDVFQYTRSSDGSYGARVKLLRPQLRAVFAFAERREAGEKATFEQSKQRGDRCQKAKRGGGIKEG